MKTVEELKDFYYDELSVSLEKLDQQRKKVKKRINTTFIIGAFFLIILSIREGSFLGFLFTLVLLYSGVHAYFVKDYTKSFKKKVISPLIKAIDENLEYSRDKHIAKSLFKRSKLFPKPDRLSGNDYVTGEVSDVSLSFSDLHAEKKYKDSKGKEEWMTIFQGFFIAADFNKNFHGKTLISPDVAESLLGDVAGNWLQSIRSGKEELVKMDNPEFEKEFVVYSTDQIEARYILSTSLMQRLLEFKKKINAPLYISFNKNSIHLAISTNEDFFEPDVFTSLLEVESAMQYIEKLHLTIGIVHDLKLDEKLWSKR